ncbi:uncharacterized protein LOC115424805 isoform X2 [Sphaeramia orbicularis]|uniref:uncharacterized protein LOC115424805 isoform X2 n=1 Tax=Sphaeramia orbicularis TaxID=375764 RepID=UPI00117D53E9|nr:uncharacterized protein LOC115424805 isoform X2 [Sphaeramia orbicularis]
MAADDFQSKYASLMETMIKSAVAETTKLFETMVDELKAEISTIRKENEHLKIRCNQIENDKSQPNDGTGDTESLPRTPSSSEKRDSAVQCELVPLQDSIVDNCELLGSSSSDLEKMHSILQKKHHGETSEEENCQVALRVVKEEFCGDSCSLMEEEEEDTDLTVVCRQVQGSLLPSACETEGPLIKEVMSLRDPLALKLCHLENDETLQTNTESCQPEHLSVIQRLITQDAKSETLHNLSEREIEGGLTISTEKHLEDYQEKLVVEPPQKEPLVSVYQESQREADVSVNNCASITLQQCADVHQDVDQLEVPTTFKNVNCEELESGLTEGASSSQPEKSSIQKRGRLPRRAKQRKSQQQPLKDIQSPSIGDHMDQNEVNTPASATENSCPVDTANTGPNPAPYVQPKDTISIINQSLHKRKKTELKDLESSNVGTLPVCSRKEHLPESKRHLVEMEGDVVPANESLPANKIQHIQTPKLSQAPSLRPRGRRTSVTLEDAMLLVEAMYQSRRENAGSCSSTMTQSQAQGVPCVPALQTVDEVPALRETPLPPQVEVECSLPIIEQSQPSEETVSAACLTSHATQTSESKAPIKVESHQRDVSASRDNLPTEPLSTLVSQARAQTSRQIFAPPVSTSAISTTENNPAPHNIFVSSLKAHALSSAQLSAVVSAVVSAQKTHSPPSSTVAAVPHGPPLLSSVPQKTIIITATKPPPVVLAQTAVTSTVNQSMIRPPQKIIIIPRQISPVVSQKQQTLVLTAKPPEPVPTVLLSSPLLVSSSQQSSISTNTLNTSELHVTVPPPQIHSLSHQLNTVDAGTVSNKVCTMSQNRHNVSDNLDSQKPTESVSETAEASTEPSASLETFAPPKSEEALSVADIPLPSKQKKPAVVRLTRLPFTISTEETVLVSRLLSNELSKTFIPTQEPSSSEETLLPQDKSRNSREQTSSPSDMPESSEICPYLDVSQISEDASDSLKPTNSASTQPPVSEPAAIGVSELSTTSSCQFSLEDSINSDGAQDCVLQNDSIVQQNQSAGLIKLSPITPKDASDPHLQMTKSQFLAQLEISPIGQAPKEVSSNSSEDISAGNGRNLQKNCLVARLRSHLKAHLQARRSEAETPVEIETTSIAPQKTKLDNNDPNDKDQGSVHVNPEEIDDSKSIPLGRSGPCENEPITGGSELSANKVSLEKDIRKLALGLRLCSSTRETANRKKNDSTSRGPNSSSRIKTTESASVSPSKSGFSKSGTTCLFSSISSTPLTRRRSTVSKDVPDAKQVKRKLNAVSPGRYSTSISKKTNIKTGSPSARWPRLNQDVTNPKKSGESALSKKPRLIKDDTVCKNTLKIVNTRKLAKSQQSKSKQSLQIGGKRRQLTENQAGCKGVKKVIVKGIWTPPLLPASEASPTGEAKSKKETKCQNQQIIYPPSPTLYPIPVRAPPIISPLQPLSVIGGRLLRNQCGACGRVFSTSAALENHVGLHTRSRPFSCKLCGKSFLDSKGLKRHDRVHRNGRIHVCPKCGKGFVYTFCLTKHLQMVHGKVRPFNCKVCKKGFFTERDLEGHIRIHTGEKPFHCNLCERKFPRRADLNVHLRWHNGEKRHWCPFCGKGFLDFNNLKRHKYIHTGEKPHSCPQCAKRFTQSSHLKKHLRNVHKIQ